MTRPKLYDLLPRYVRYRDALEGEPLRRVLEALEIPYRAVLEDVEALYDGWFIETCDLWRVPYVADLLGVRGLGEDRALLPSQRTRVANALAYRRHRGTPAALERVVSDATGWPCHLVDQAATTSRTASLRVGTGSTSADLRRGHDLERLGGPFNVVAHGADLKALPAGPPPLGDRGGFLPTQVGLALHRLSSQPVHGADARRVTGDGFTFHPFGIDVPLFGAQRTPDAAVYRSAPDALPAPLSSTALRREVEARRRSDAGASDFLGEVPAWRIFLSAARPAEDGGTAGGDAGGDADDGLVERIGAHRLDGEGWFLVRPEETEVCDLGDWRGPEVGEGVLVLVDPERGRLRLAPGSGVDGDRPVRVDYHYGAVHDLGGGAYPRRPAETTAGGDGLTVLAEGAEERRARTVGEQLWTAVVARDAVPGFDAKTGVHAFRTLDEALAAWGRVRRLPIPPPHSPEVAPKEGRITLADSATYRVREALELRGRRLRIEAEDGCVPCLEGDLEILGPQERTLTRTSATARALALRNRLTLAGLWIDGGLRITGGVSLVVEHCTVAPPHPDRGSSAAALAVAGDEVMAARMAKMAATLEPSALHAFSVRIRHSILGPVRLGSHAVDLEIEDSLVDGGGPGRASVVAREGQVRLVRTTSMGKVEAGRLTLAADCLFTAPLEVAIRGEGVVVSSRVPEGSRTPPRKLCVGGKADREASLFTSHRFGDPAYGQLARTGGEALLGGAGNGNEMGVFNGLRQSDRLANLASVLETEVPWGTRPRIWFVT